jgi:hypothetical protein
MLIAIILLVMDKVNMSKYIQASELLETERARTYAQIASAYDDLYKSKPPEYAFPATNEEIIRAIFKDDAALAISIAKCESGLRADARNVNNNGTVDVGLFQINSVHGVSERFLTDPITNTMVAKEIYDGRGNWSAWVCAGKVGL